MAPQFHHAKEIQSCRRMVSTMRYVIVKGEFFHGLEGALSQFLSTRPGWGSERSHSPRLGTKRSVEALRICSLQRVGDSRAAWQRAFSKSGKGMASAAISSHGNSRSFVRRKAFQLELQAYRRVKTFVGNASSGFAHSMDGARSGKIRVGGHFNPKARSRTTMSTPTWSSNSSPNCQAVQYLCGWERCDLDSMARNVYGKDKWHVLVDASQARCARFRQRRINYVAALERLVALVATRQAKLAQFRELQRLLATTPPDQSIFISSIS
ncbi:unnamed protein product [Aphanomyces euteiches]